MTIKIKRSSTRSKPDSGSGCGGDIVSSVISQIPIEFHMRDTSGKKYSFCGPNTNASIRLCCTYYWWNYCCCGIIYIAKQKSRNKKEYIMKYIQLRQQIRALNNRI